MFSATAANEPGRDLYRVRADGGGLERLTATVAREMTPGEWQSSRGLIRGSPNRQEFAVTGGAESLT